MTDRPGNRVTLFCLDCEWVTELAADWCLLEACRSARMGGPVAADLDVLGRTPVAPELRNALRSSADNAFDLTYETKQYDEVARSSWKRCHLYAGELLTEWDAAADQPELSLLLLSSRISTAVTAGIPTLG